MRSNTCTLVATIGMAVCVLFAPDAKGACKVLGVNTPFASSTGVTAFPSPLAMEPALSDSQGDGEYDGHSKKRNAIVGTWITDFYPGTSTEPSDHTIEQFSSDGNELIDSGGFAPASDNKCFGIWQAAGQRTITLTHIGWDFDVATGAFKGTARLVATITLSRDGDRFVAKFTQDEVDTAGNVIVGPVEGTMKSRRFRPATSVTEINPR